MIRIIAIIVCCTSLMACAMFQGSKKNNHDAICKELRYQILWNGATGDPMTLNGGTGNQIQTNQQLAETGVLEKNYHDEGCMDDKPLYGDV